MADKRLKALKRSKTIQDHLGRVGFKDSDTVDRVALSAATVLTDASGNIKTVDSEGVSSEVSLAGVGTLLVELELKALAAAATATGSFNPGTATPTSNQRGGFWSPTVVTNVDTAWASDAFTAPADGDYQFIVPSHRQWIQNSATGTPSNTTVSGNGGSVIWVSTSAGAAGSFVSYSYVAGGSIGLKVAYLGTNKSWSLTDQVDSTTFVLSLSATDVVKFGTGVASSTGTAYSPNIAKVHGGGANVGATNGMNSIRIYQL